MTTPTLVTLITKNRGPTTSDCHLRSVQGPRRQIVVLRLGSSDGTVEIAQLRRQGDGQHRLARLRHPEGPRAGAGHGRLGVEPGRRRARQRRARRRDPPRRRAVAARYNQPGRCGRRGRRRCDTCGLRARACRASAASGCATATGTPTGCCASCAATAPASPRIWSTSVWWSMVRWGGSRATCCTNDDEPGRRSRQDEPLHQRPRGSTACAPASVAVWPVRWATACGPSCAATSSSAASSTAGSASCWPSTSPKAPYYRYLKMALALRPRPSSELTRNRRLCSIHADKKKPDRRRPAGEPGARSRSSASRSPASAPPRCPSPSRASATKTRRRSRSPPPSCVPTSSAAASSARSRSTVRRSTRPPGRR